MLIIKFFLFLLFFYCVEWKRPLVSLSTLSFLGSMEKSSSSKLLLKRKKRKRGEEEVEVEVETKKACLSGVVRFKEEMIGTGIITEFEVFSGLVTESQLFPELFEELNLYPEILFENPSQQTKEAKLTKISQANIPDQNRTESAEDWIKDLEFFGGGVKSYSDLTFQKGLEELKVYTKEKGNARVPKKFKTQSGFNLGSWVSTKRVEYKKKPLSEDRIQALESFPGWIWNSFEADFQEGLEALKIYIEEKGNARVLQSFKTEDDFNLGSWVKTKRTEYKKNRLSQDWIKELESLSGWVWEAYETDFEEGLEVLEIYIEEKGNARVFQSFQTEDGFNLGSWVKNRRREYREKTLSQDRIDRLESFSRWVWDPLEADFQEGLEELKIYVQNKGNAKVLQGFQTQGGFKLGSWVKNKRVVYKQGHLPQAWIKALESLAGWIWTAKVVKKVLVKNG